MAAPNRFTSSTTATGSTIELTQDGCEDEIHDRTEKKQRRKNIESPCERHPN
jgi:hypothetical protein